MVNMPNKVNIPTMKNNNSNMPLSGEIEKLGQLVSGLTQMARPTGTANAQSETVSSVETMDFSNSRTFKLENPNASAKDIADQIITFRSVQTNDAGSFVNSNDLKQAEGKSSSLAKAIEKIPEENREEIINTLVQKTLLSDSETDYIKDLTSNLNEVSKTLSNIPGNSSAATKLVLQNVDKTSIETYKASLTANVNKLNKSLENIPKNNRAEVLEILASSSKTTSLEDLTTKIKNTTKTAKSLEGEAKMKVATETVKEVAGSIADDNIHKYSQEHRTGPDYDCASFVAKVLIDSGFDQGTLNWNGKAEGKGLVGWPMTTNNEPDILKALGYKEYSIGEGKLKKGDIVWEPNHTEIYSGNGNTIGAHGADDYAPDDQISEVSMYNNYTSYFRYEGNGSGIKLNEAAQKELYTNAARKVAE